MAKNVDKYEVRHGVALSEHPRCELFQFADLKSMDRAMLAAVSTEESEVLIPHKGLTLVFAPTGSMIFDTFVVKAVESNGGKSILKDKPYADIKAKVDQMWEEAHKSATHLGSFN